MTRSTDARGEESRLTLRQRTDSDGGGYLLDANCYYIASNEGRVLRKLRLIADKLRLSHLNVMEIANADSESFEKRNRAMRALADVDPRPLRETPDGMVSIAFGTQPARLSSRERISLIRAVTSSSSHEELSAKVNIGALNEWKRYHSERFQRDVDIMAAEVRDRIAVARNSQVLSEPTELPPSAADVAESFFDGAFARRFTILGLAVRAKLISEEELQEAVAADKLEDLDGRVQSHYDGTLEPYVAMYQEVACRAVCGKPPEHNAVFDLEYLLHLRPKGGLKFVTTEKMLLSVSADALPGRVIHLSELIGP